MNPPYNKDLHLDFLEKSLNICNKTIIIEPGQWLVQLKENGKYTKDSSQAKQIKNKIDGHITSLEFNNYNKELHISNKTVISILAIDMSKKYKSFEFDCCGEKRIAHTINDCNLIGDFSLVSSILKKCKSYKDHMIDHVIDIKKYKDYENKGYWFLPYGNYMINSLGSNNGGNSKIFYQNDYKSHAVNVETKFGDFYNSYTIVLATDKKEQLTYDIVPKGEKRGSPRDSTYGTKEQMENWYYFVYNNKLPLFVNICLTIDEHNNSREYVPWLVDKKYTDEEIYKKLNITKEEQNLIDEVLVKFERKSNWFKQYMLGL
jgi:hypothetical protein